MTNAFARLPIFFILIIVFATSAISCAREETASKSAQVSKTKPANQSETISKGESETKFERLAGKFKFICTGAFLYDHTDFRWIPRAEAQKYRQLLAEFSVLEAEVFDIVELLKNKDPKVRTLALAALFAKKDPKLLPHIVSMVDDCAEAFPELIRPFGIPADEELKMPPMIKQSVGQVATRMINFYIKRAGYHYGPKGYGEQKGFDAYWVQRKDRSYCASWFAVQLARADQAIYPTREGRTERIQAVRKRIDKIPEPDRTWILLWLNGEAGSNVLVTEEELLEFCKKLGPEKLLLMLMRKIPSDDPDVQPRKSNNWPYRRMCLFVLKRADKLFRKQDAEALLACERWERDYTKHGISDPTITPWWAIAAAHLQPDKAEAILHEAFWRFDDKYDGDERADIAAALWELVGKSQTGFLINWFYTEPLNRGYGVRSQRRFIETVSKVPNSHTRHMIAAIIGDKRLEELYWEIIRTLIFVVNKWVKKPVVDKNIAWKARPPFGDRFHRMQQEAIRRFPKKTEEFLKRLDEFRKKLRASVPRWNK